MRTYRVGATMGPLFGWNILDAILIAVVLSNAVHARSNERMELYAIAAALILLGPVCLIVYLVRYFRVGVRLETDGIVVSGRYRIPFSDIRAVELRGWRPQPWNPFGSVEITSWSWVILIFLCKVILLLLVIVFVLWILWTVLVPVAVLYSPWHSRVVIETVDGTRLVYRDLEDAEGFVRTLWEEIPAA